MDVPPAGPLLGLGPVVSGFEAVEGGVASVSAMFTVCYTIAHASCPKEATGSDYAVHGLLTWKAQEAVGDERQLVDMRMPQRTKVRAGRHVGSTQCMRHPTLDTH